MGPSAEPATIVRSSHRLVSTGGPGRSRSVGDGQERKGENESACRQDLATLPRRWSCCRSVVRTRLGAAHLLLLAPDIIDRAGGAVIPPFNSALRVDLGVDPHRTFVTQHYAALRAHGTCPTVPCRRLDGTVCNREAVGCMFSRALPPMGRALRYVCGYARIFAIESRHRPRGLRHGGYRQREARDCQEYFHWSRHVSLPLDLGMIIRRVDPVRQRERARRCLMRGRKWRSPPRAGLPRRRWLQEPNAARLSPLVATSLWMARRAPAFTWRQRAPPFRGPARAPFAAP